MQLTSTRKLNLRSVISIDGTTMASPYQAELELAKSAALKAGDIIRSYSNGNGGRSSNSATVCVKSVEYHVASIIQFYRGF